MSRCSPLKPATSLNGLVPLAQHWPLWLLQLGGSTTFTPQDVTLAKPSCPVRRLGDQREYPTPIDQEHLQVRVKVGLSNGSHQAIRINFLKVYFMEEQIGGLLVTPVVVPPTDRARPVEQPFDIRVDNPSVPLLSQAKNPPVLFSVEDFFSVEVAFMDATGLFWKRSRDGALTPRTELSR